MKARIHKDEWYPVFSLEEDTKKAWAGNSIEVDDELWARWTAAEKEFDAIQEILSDLWDKSERESQA